MAKSTTKGNTNSAKQRKTAQNSAKQRKLTQSDPRNLASTRFINQLSKKLTAHLKKNSGAPTDDFMVKAVCIQLKHYFALERKIDKDKVSPKAMKQFNDQFLLIMGLFKDLGVMPKQLADLKKKVQAIGSSDKETKEVNTAAYTSDISPITL